MKISKRKLLKNCSNMTAWLLMISLSQNNINNRFGIYFMLQQNLRCCYSNIGRLCANSLIVSHLYHHINTKIIHAKISSQIVMLSPGIQGTARSFLMKEAIKRNLTSIEYVMSCSHLYSMFAHRHLQRVLFVMFYLNNIAMTI